MVSAVAALETTLDAVRGAVTWSIPDGELLELIPRLQRVQSRIEGALLFPLVEQARRTSAAEKVGAGSLRSWLAGRLRIGDAAAKRLVSQAADLDARLPATSTALADGAIGSAHARVIAQALEQLPERRLHRPIDQQTDPQSDAQTDRAGDQTYAGPAELTARAERFLVAKAADLTPAEVRVLGAKVLEFVAPEAAEVAEAAAAERLAAVEADAVAGRSLRGRLVGDRVRIDGWLDRVGWATVRTALDPLAVRRPGPDGSPDVRGRDRRLADALIDLAERSQAAGGLPEHGKVRPTLLVRFDHDQLAADVGAGLLADGTPISAGTARRLACEANLIPAVFGGGSQLLDLGRSRRLFTGAVYLGLLARDGGCTFPHACATAAPDCHAHHMPEWRSGGRTSVDTGTLTCKVAHYHAHHDGWVARLNPVDGLPQWVPPAWYDPTRRPRRHPRLPPPAPG